MFKCDFKIVLGYSGPLKTVIMSIIFQLGRISSLITTSSLK